MRADLAAAFVAWAAGYAPVSGDALPPRTRGAREHVIVLRGSIRVGPVGEEILLEAGDYATYLANRTHRWQTGADEAEVWILHTFPRFSPLGE